MEKVEDGRVNGKEEREGLVPESEGWGRGSVLYLYLLY